MPIHTNNCPPTPAIDNVTAVRVKIAGLIERDAGPTERTSATGVNVKVTGVSVRAIVPPV